MLRYMDLSYLFQILLLFCIDLSKERILNGKSKDLKMKNMASSKQ